SSDLLDRDQAEAAGREGIAEYGIDPRRDARRPPGLLGQHEIADPRLAEVGDGELAPLLLLDRLQPVPLALLVDHAEDQFAALEQLFHRMRDPAAVFALFGARQDAVADAQRLRPAPLALHHAEARRIAFRLPP